MKNLMKTMVVLEVILFLFGEIVSCKGNTPSGITSAPVTSEGEATTSVSVPTLTEPISEQQLLLEALNDLEYAMIKKIQLEVDVTAQCFTSIKEYRRAKLLADVLRPVLRVLQGTLSVVSKIGDAATLSGQFKDSFDSAQYVSEAASLIFMVNGLRESGEKLYYVIDDTAGYVNTVRDMLEAADQTTVIRMDPDTYKKVIKQYLDGDRGTPLVIARTSELTSDKRPVQGALSLQKIIREEFRMLFDETQRTEFPPEFQLKDAISDIGKLKHQIVESGTRNMDVNYSIYHRGGRTNQSRKLGAIAEHNKAFASIARAVADRLRLEIHAEYVQLAGTGADVVYIVTYNIPGAREAAKITQQATLLPGIVIEGEKMFTVDPEDEFYQMPQEMIFSLTIEFSNVLRIADDTVLALTELIKETNSTVASTEGAPIQSVQKLREEKILYSLIQKLKGQDPNVRNKAAKTLGEMKNPRAVEPLINAMKGNFPYSGPLKDRLVGGEFSYVRVAAAEALGEIKDPRAVEPLIDAMKNPHHHKVQEEAARSLGKIGDPRAIEPLMSAVKNDKYDSVRSEAIWALGEMKNPLAVDLLISVLKGEIKAPRTIGAPVLVGELDNWAAIALREIGEPAVIPLINAYKVALKEKNSSVRLLAEKALKKIKDQRAVEPLIGALKDEDWKVREMVADLLGAFNDHRAIEPLIVALVDKHIIVRSSVRGALTKITGEHFGNDQMKWKRWWERRLEETPEAQMEKVPMWVFEPLTHTSTHYSPRYPRRLIYPVSEINTTSRDLVYLIKAKKNNLEIRGKTDQLIFSRKLIITEMKSGLKTVLETLRPEVAEELKSNLATIVKEIEEIIYLVKAPGFQNNLEKIRSIQNQINETSRKIIDILE